MLEKVPRDDRDMIQIRQLEDERCRLKAQLSHGPANDILASIGYEMWYFGVLLYQLCTVDGKTLWNVDQADNIEPGEMQDLAFRWSDLKASKLSKVVWPEACELIGRLLEEAASDRPQSWKEVLEHPFLSGEGELLRAVKDHVTAEVKASQATIIAGQMTIVQKLCDQTEQLTTISKSTAATFTALKDLSEGTSAVPRLVTIALKDSSDWQGAWYERTGDNLLAKVKGKVGITQFMHLHFLCEKTLRPVEGHPGYELEVPGKKFEEFMQKARPILGVTCALLKLVTAVGRPVAKLAGVDLPKVGNVDLGALKKVELGESTIGEVFEGTGIGTLFDKIESIGQSESESEPEPEADGTEAISASEGQELLNFADNAIARLEAAADQAGFPLTQLEDEGEDPPTAETVRASVDQIKEWINDACKKLNRPSDLEKQVIGGLRKTVMKDGRTLWLSPGAATRWADEVEVVEEPELEPETEPETETETEIEPELEPEPEPEPAERPKRRWAMCLSSCSTPTNVHPPYLYPS